MGFTDFLNKDEISVGICKALLLETLLGIVGASILEDNLAREALGAAGGLSILGVVTYIAVSRGIGWPGTIAFFGKR